MAQRPQHGDGRQAEPAGADQHHRIVGRQRQDLAHRAIDGDAGARIGRGDGGIDVAGIDEMPWMRGDDMGAVAAILIDAQAARRHAIPLYEVEEHGPK